MEKYLQNEEKITFELRALYAQYGYQRYKMNKFEEYDFYAENKEFLVSGNVITFTDVSGRLMALKPDVTLSIARHHADTAGVSRVYYNENVYRAQNGEFREIMQTGLECIGALDGFTVGETVVLAAKSLACIGKPYKLCISHMGLLTAAMRAVGLSERENAALLQAVESKNATRIRQLCAAAKDTAACETLCALTEAYGSLHAVLPTLQQTAPAAVYAELVNIDKMLQAAGVADHVQFDFSLSGDTQYYNGVVFCGFIEGLPRAVLTGGRYDLLMRKLGKENDAIGFAVYLDLLERLEQGAALPTPKRLTYTAKTAMETFKRAEQLRAQGTTVIVEKEG